LLSLLGKSDKSTEFVYGNGRCGRATIVPQAKVNLPSRNMQGNSNG
jgi:hypothetical protein